MYRIIVIGGGWSGCAAALAAKKAGADVTLIEKTDLLLGLGNVGGIMRNNGRFTAAEENIGLGAAELFGVTDKYSRHVNVDFPGHKHASLYDVMKVEPAVRRLLQEEGVKLRMMTRIIDVTTETVQPSSEESRKYITSLVAVRSGAVRDNSDRELLEADAFIECTGSTGPMGNCLTYGNGCCMCILRCPAFGPRVSISQKAGITDIMGMRKDGSFGAFSGSGKLEKESLSEDIQKKLNETGVVIIPVTYEQKPFGRKLSEEEIVKEKTEEAEFRKAKLNMKVCQQYALGEYADNIILLDTGYAKIMTPFFPLEKLRMVEGFENARYADPYAGGKGNSIRYLSVAERDNGMRVTGIENLLCGGEKSGLFVGHTEAITTGSLAGYNGARYLKGLPPMELPTQLAVGDLIGYANKQLKTKEGLMTRYTFAGAQYFERMQEKGLYSAEPEVLKRRVKRAGLQGIYNESII